MLPDNSAGVVVPARTRAIPLAMKALRKSNHGFPFPSFMSMGIRLGRRSSATNDEARHCLLILISSQSDGLKFQTSSFSVDIQFVRNVCLITRKI